jgi:hypothetical protein
MTQTNNTWELRRQCEGSAVRSTREYDRSGTGTAWWSGAGNEIHSNRYVDQHRRSYTTRNTGHLGPPNTDRGVAPILGAVPGTCRCVDVAARMVDWGAVGLEPRGAATSFASSSGRRLRETATAWSVAQERFVSRTCAPNPSVYHACSGRLGGRCPSNNLRPMAGRSHGPAVPRPDPDQRRTWGRFSHLCSDELVTTPAHPSIPWRDRALQLRHRR